MRAALFLAASALRHTPLRAGLLVLSLALALGLPLTVRLASERLDGGLRARAASTPLVLGPPGHTQDLVLSTLTFRGDPAPPLLGKDLRRVQATDPGRVVPLRLLGRAAGAPLVGVRVEYFAARGLRIATGRGLGLVGEAVLGASAARSLHLAPGATVQHDGHDPFDLRAPGAVDLHVVGVLTARGNADDDAIFVELATTWLLDGDLHGHDDADPSEDREALMSDTTLDAAARARLHLHGDRDDLPVGALLVWPRDPRAHDLLLGDFAEDSAIRAVLPDRVVLALLDHILRLRNAATTLLLPVVCSTLALSGVILLLGFRGRADEFHLLRRLGAPAKTLLAMVAVEVSLVLGAALVLAFGGVALVLRSVGGLG